MVENYPKTVLEMEDRFNTRQPAWNICGKLFYRLVQQAMMVDPAPRLPCSKAHL
jgi:hypothetical protein